MKALGYSVWASLFFAGLIAPGVAAQDQIEPPAAASEGEIIVEGEVKEDPKVCKRSKPPTASRIARSKKICKLASEWAAEEAQMAELNDQRRRNVMTQSQRTTSDAFNKANSPIN